MALTKAQRVGGASALAAALIAIPMEGVVKHAYIDPAGIETACIGHTGPGVVHGKHYTLDECMELLDADMRQAATIVEDCWPRRLPLKTLAAFADLTFNVGPRAVCDVEQSTLARKIRDNDLAGACRELPRWNKARVAGVLVPLPGLTKRRETEMNLCLEGVKDGPF